MYMCSSSLTSSVHVVPYLSCYLIMYIVHLYFFFVITCILQVVCTLYVHSFMCICIIHSSATDSRECGSSFLKTQKPHTTIMEPYSQDTRGPLSFC